MIYLSSPNQKLEIVLAGAVTTNALEVEAFFFDLHPQVTTTVRRGGDQRSTSNNTTDVTIVSAPALQGIIRNIHTISIHNKDTVTATVTVKLDNSGTETILVKQALQAGDSLTYEDNAGWVVLTPITAPFVDTTLLVKGSADATKFLRIEVDGITTSTTRVWTVADADIKVAGHATGFTSGRVPYATGATGGVLTDSANLTFDGTTLTAHTLTVSTGTLTASANLTVNGNATLGNAATDTHRINGLVQVQCDSSALGIDILARATSDDFGILRWLNNAGSTAWGLIRQGSSNNFDFFTGSGSGVQQLAVMHDSLATRFVRIWGSATNPIIDTTAGNLSIAPGGGTTAITGALTVSTTLAVNGNVTLGDAVGDSHTVNGLVRFIDDGGGIEIERSGGGDQILLVPQVAGSGGSIIGLNDAGTDYEPLVVSAEVFGVYARTGAGTVAEIHRTTSAGILFPTDNTYDIGASGATRPRDFFLGRNATITGTLAVTSTTTLSAALTYGGVTLSNAVTGTGNMVLSASPTFTGTVNAAAVTASGAVAGSTASNIAIGTGSGTGTHVVVANINTTAVGNVGTGADTLMSYTLPANSLSANGKAIRITAWGTTANNANAKTLTFNFGGAGISGYSLTTSQAGIWRYEIVITRTGASAQDIGYRLTESLATLSTTVKMATNYSSAFTQDETTALSINFTGEATSNNDITQEFMLVEFLN